MNVPNLPTDNLYKFIALFGLVLFGFSYYLEFYADDSLDEIDLTYNGLLTEHAKKTGDVAILADSVLINLEHIKQRQDFELKKLTNERDRYDDLVETSFWIRFIGAVLVLLGFVLWYILYQRFIDAEVKYKGQKFIGLLKKQEEDKDFKPVNKGEISENPEPHSDEDSS